MPHRLTRRALLRCAQGLFALTAVCTASAQKSNDFAVTPAQMQSLGVRLLKLEQPAAINGQAFPARVVLPPSQEYVLSAPVAGVVDQLLVSENDSVQAGQPLLRLVSPELGELQLKLSEAASKGRLTQATLKREQLLFAEGIVPTASRAGSGVRRRRRAGPTAARRGGTAPGRHGRCRHQARGRRRRDAGCAGAACTRTRHRGQARSQARHAGAGCRRPGAHCRHAQAVAGHPGAGGPPGADRHQGRFGHRGRSGSDGHAAGLRRHGQRQPDRHAARTGHARERRRCAWASSCRRRCRLPAAGTWAVPMAGGPRRTTRPTCSCAPRPVFSARPVTVVDSAGQSVQRRRMRCKPGRRSP